MKRAIVALAAASSLAAATPALAAKPSPLGPPPPSGASLPDGECILSHDIRNHAIVDKNTILFDVFAKGIYRVTTKPACFMNTVSSDPIAFYNVGKTKICKAKDLGLMARGGHCGGDSIVKLTPHEVAALPRGLRP